MPKDKTAVNDAVKATLNPDDLKGPDAEVWGSDEERPQADTAQGVAPGEILNEGEEDELKGPDPDVWGSESGAEATDG